MRSFGDEESIFVDMDRLNPNTQTYKPETLPERESELDQLHSALRPATLGSTPLNALVFGPTGQGKTVGITLKTSQLQKFADDKGIDLHVVHVRCKGMEKSYHVMTHLLKSLREKRFGPGEELPSGYQKKTLLSMIIDELEAIGGTVIVILDEIDAIGRTTTSSTSSHAPNRRTSASPSSASRTTCSFAKGSTPTSGRHSARTRSSSHRTTRTNSAISSRAARPVLFATPRLPTMTTRSRHWIATYSPTT